VLLKHTGLLAVAAEVAASDSAAATAAASPRVLRSLAGLWRKCIDIGPSLNRMKGSGQDVAAFAQMALARAQFLLDLAPATASPTASAGAEADIDLDSEDEAKAKAGADAAGDGKTASLAAGPAKTWKKAAAATKMFQTTVKAVHRMQDIMRLSSWRASDRDDAHAPSVVVEHALAFVMSESPLDLEALFQGLQEQRTRAMNRLVCFRFVRQIVEMPTLRSVLANRVTPNCCFVAFCHDAG
jgi:hypothetical protein